MSSNNLGGVQWRRERKVYAVYELHRGIAFWPKGKGMERGKARGFEKRAAREVLGIHGEK